MIFVQTLALFLAVISLIAVLAVLKKTKHPFRTAATQATLGLGAFAAVNLLAGYTGVTLSLNYFTSFVAVVLGAPGVICMLVVRVLVLA